MSGAMQDSTPGWARYIEELEAQAMRLPRRRRSAVSREGRAMALGALVRRVVAFIAGRPKIGG
ncbi:hypothetical protein HNP73_000105 [Amaricoccus macauensis]|uniref:Uncharacterized protein n=1 Tax=Amaricoccus macauensis TaxID=57001 RepID=A0A840SGY9_9RHOB|nr:hypothetical protein [Amaricoccus macauensis]MBB5220184.1 hypothetical protein [Amaricoccus macauensis]